MLYHHTQRGRFPLALTVAATIVMTGVLIASRRPAVLLGLVPISVIGAVFTTLTIDVDESELRYHFGLGVWRTRVAIDDIVDASRTRSYWLEGWGIRITSRGMLYNVSGTDAVEIRLRSGSRFRVGTDEPDVLLAALRQAGVPTGAPAGV